MAEKRKMRKREKNKESGNKSKSSTQYLFCWNWKSTDQEFDIWKLEGMAQICKNTIQLWLHCETNICSFFMIFHWNLLLEAKSDINFLYCSNSSGLIHLLGADCIWLGKFCGLLRILSDFQEFTKILMVSFASYLISTCHCPQSILEETWIDNLNNESEVLEILFFLGWNSNT